MKKILFLVSCLFLLNLNMSCNAQTQEPVSVPDLEITVYQQNLALIRDVREFSLKKGIGETEFRGISPLIQTESLALRSIRGGGDLLIREVSYHYDLANTHELLKRHIGKKIKLIEWNQFQDRKEVVEAELLSLNGPVYRIKGEVYIGHPGTQVLPDFEETAALEPALRLTYDNKGQERRTVEIAYLTGGLDWSADYTMILNDKDKSAHLTGWVILTNHSGIPFENAKLKIVAGNINRIAKAVPQAMMMRGEMVMADAERSSFQTNHFSDYHQYDLNWSVSVENQGKKQFVLLEANGIKFEKKYRTYSQHNYYYQNNTAQGVLKQPVKTVVLFKNSKENHLGSPMPAGTIRTYAIDHEGSALWSGDAPIAHTPKDEEIELTVGEAFDLVAERKQMSYQAITRQLHESEWQVELINRKGEPAVIEVYETIGGNWEMISHNIPYEKVNATTVKFEVPLKAGEAYKIQYKVRAGL